MQKIQANISEDKTTISFEMDDISIFKDPRMLIKMNRWGSSIEGNTLSIPVNENNLEQQFEQASSLFKNMGHEVFIADAKPLLDIQNNEDLFLQSCIKARGVWDGDIEPDDFKDFSRIIQERFKQIKVYKKQLLSAYHLAASTSACNFSVPGAGKTIIVLTAYAYLNSLPKNDSRWVNCIFVVGPIACFKPWEHDSELCFSRKLKSIRFLPPMNAERRKKIALGVDASYRDTELYLSHFQTFAANQKLFIDLCKRPDKRVMLVIDEAHYIKGIDKVWSSAMLNVAPYANSRVILTGTPAPNGYEDLKNLFDFIHPKKNILGFNISQLNRMSKGKTSVSPLNEKAKSFFTRITKKNLDIPEPIFTVKAIQMSPKQERIYTLINSKVANNRKQRKLFMNANLIRLRQAASNPMILTEPIEEELYGANINDELMTAQSLQEIASQVKEFNNDDDLPKLQALLDEVKTAKEKNERILIWTYFIKNVELIHRHLVKNLSDIDINVITGATPVEKSDVHFDPNHELTREKTLEKFRANKPSVLLATPHCIGESISLHKHCHKAIYYDRDYNCGLFIQSKDRIHRFGLTKNDITEYIFLVSKDTIDEIIANTLNDKETRMIDMLESDEIPLLAEEDEETIQLNIINKIIESYHERQL